MEQRKYNDFFKCNVGMTQNLDQKRTESLPKLNSTSIGFRSSNKTFQNLGKDISGNGTRETGVDELIKALHPTNYTCSNFYKGTHYDPYHGVAPRVPHYLSDPQY
ncbi:MAG: hypothetical protein MJ252_26435 [archaeon]|nr:hypothetical protein [archaeon]